jgi:hypothetical protein
MHLYTYYMVYECVVYVSFCRNFTCDVLQLILFGSLLVVAPPEMFTLAKSCLCSTTFKFEVMTVYMSVEDKIKNKCEDFKMNQRNFSELRSRLTTYVTNSPCRNHGACIFNFAVSICGLQFWCPTFVK